MQTDDVLLPSEALLSSPSQKEGIEADVEQLHRIFGCELIQEVGILLRLPQVVMATGQNILQRFFYRKSLLRFDVFSIAMGCIMLSCKVEEKPKMIREILFVFHHVYQKRKKLVLTPLELGGERYNQWKMELLSIERHILKELGFSLYTIMDHPHKYILYYAKMLNGTHELSQMSWNYLNDSLRLDLSVRYPAREIACAAILMSARQLQFSLSDEPPWWRLMTTNIENVYQICESILQLYTLPKFNWIEPLAKSAYLSPDVCSRFDTLAPLDSVDYTAQQSEHELTPQPHSDVDSVSGLSSKGAPDMEDGCEQRNDRHRNSAGRAAGDGARGGVNGASRDGPEKTSKHSHRDEDRQLDRDRERGRDTDRGSRSKYRSTGEGQQDSYDDDHDGKDNVQQYQDRQLDLDRSGRDRDRDGSRNRDRDRNEATHRARDGRDSHDRGRDRDRDRDMGRDRGRGGGDSRDTDPIKDRGRDRGRDRDRDRDSRDRGRGGVGRADRDDSRDRDRRRR